MKNILEVKNLSAGYREKIISEVSFSASAGEKTGIIGINGAGKTTLLKAIAGTVKRFSGEILINGEEIKNLSVKKQAEYLSFLPQKTYVPEGICVYDILMMGLYPRNKIFAPLKGSDREKIKKAASMTGTEDCLYKDFSVLSAGRQQMVMLTRMFIQDTPLMLFDEPDSALDFNNTKKIFSYLTSYIKENEKAGLFVLHNPSSALSFCDKIMLMDRGGITAFIDVKNETPEEIQEKLQKIYPGIRTEKNPYNGEYICF